MPLAYITNNLYSLKERAMKPVERQVTLPIEAISIRKGEYLMAWLSADNKPYTG